MTTKSEYSPLKENNKTIFNRNIKEARSLLNYAISHGTTDNSGKSVNDSIIEGICEIEDAFIKANGDYEKVDLNVKIKFEKSFRDLTDWMWPITATTLKCTERYNEDGSLKKRFLLFFHRTEAGLYFSIFLLISVLFIIMLIFGNYFYKINNKEIEKIITSMQIIEPYIYGGLGASTSLLQRLHIYIRQRNFNPYRTPEYISLIILGIISGGTVTMFVGQLSSDNSTTYNISAAMLGFIAGYNMDFLFAAIDRVVSAIFPKSGQTPPQPPTAQKNASATEDPKK